MNYEKENAVGIDVFLNRLQKRIYSNLVSKWGEFDLYGRVYKNVSSDGTTKIERYIGNNEYEPLLFSEGNKVFFVQDDNVDFSFGIPKCKVWAVCILDLEKINNTNDRTDEQAHQEFVNAIASAVGKENLHELLTGFQNLGRIVDNHFSYNSSSFQNDTGNFKFSDLQPYHFFMVRVTAEYNLLKNNC